MNPHDGKKTFLAELKPDQQIRQVYPSCTSLYLRPCSSLISQENEP